MMRYHEILRREYRMGQNDIKVRIGKKKKDGFYN